MTKQKKIVYVLTLVILVLTAYMNVMTCGFTGYDDTSYTVDNPIIRSGIDLHAIRWTFTTFDMSNWHPVTWLSYLIDYHIYGVNPVGYHVENVLLHCINTLLLLYLLNKSTGRYFESLFVASLFALHPLHVESVAWIAERKDLLSTLFLLLTFIAYRSYLFYDNRKYYWVALVFYATGLMAKPMLVTLPVLLLCFEYWPFPKRQLSFNKVVVEKIPFFALSFFSCVTTIYAQHYGKSISSIDDAPLLFRLENAVISYLKYLSKMFFPVNLAAIYPLNNAKMPTFIIASIMLVSVTCLAILYRKKYPYVLVGWLWFLVSLLPVIGIIQVGSQAMADRYTYIPLIGLFIALTWLISDAVKPYNNRRLLGYGSIVIVIILWICTWRQVRYWENGIELFTHAANSVENNYIAYRNLGNMYARQGNMMMGMNCLKEAIKIRPYDAIAHTDLGVALASQGRYEEAIYHYESALQYNSKSALTYYNYGVALALAKRHETALFYYEKALKIDPDNIGAITNMGVTLYHLGRIDEAIDYLNKALLRDPNNDGVRQFLANAIETKNKRNYK